MPEETPRTRVNGSQQACTRDRCRQLLKRYPASMVNFCWFTDEKIFTVAAPSNSQNDRLYAPVAVRKKDVAADRLLRTQPTFSKSVMVSVGVGAWTNKPSFC